MLTKRDLRYNVYTFSYLSRAWCFPTKFNRSTGTFHVPNRGRRRNGFRIVLAIFIAHSMLLSGRTFAAGAIYRNIPLKFLAFSIMESFSFSALCVMGILIYRRREIHAKLWSELLNRIEKAGGSIGSDKRTWDEFMICYMPFLLHPFVFIFPVVYSVNYNLPCCIYGVVPAVLQSTPLLILCCLIDIVLFSFYLSLSNYLMVFTMAFIRQMKLELQSLKEKAVRFGIHPECDGTAQNVQQAIQFLEIEKKEESEARTTVKAEDKSSLKTKMEVVCEVTKKAGDVENNSKVRMRPRKEIKGFKPEANERVQSQGERVKQEAKLKAVPELRDLEEDEIGYVPEPREAWSQVGDKTAGTTWELKTDSESPLKKVKRWVSNRTTRWILRKAETWVNKRAGTRAGKAVEKWVAKRSGNRAVRKIDPWLVTADNQLADKREENRAVDRDIERVVNLEMEVMKAITETTDVEELRTACKMLEVLRLLFRLYNHGFANIIFVHKMMGITTPVWGMYAAVRLAGSHPDFAFFYGFISSVCVSLYIGLFNNAFHLMGIAEICKSLILLQSTTLYNRKQQSKEDWNEIRCRIAAIPKLAIYSGHFHALERDSVPIFINFILNKLADLLLTF